MCTWSLKPQIQAACSAGPSHILPDCEGLNPRVNATNEKASFLRLANALSALYPAGSEEKRLLDAMLLAVPR